MIGKRVLTKEQMKELSNLVCEGIITDGGHHKQYYLIEICKLLKLDITMCIHKLDLEEYGLDENATCDELVDCGLIDGGIPD